MKFKCTFFVNDKVSDSENCEDYDTAMEWFERSFADETGEYPSEDCYHQFSMGKRVEHLAGNRYSWIVEEMK